MSDNSTPIQNITVGPRQTNIEILRIVLMFMVMGLHANYVIFGAPTSLDFQNHALPSVTRIFLECLCIPAVNTYVIISGYFSIKFSIKGVSSLIFQVVFLSLFILIVYIWLGDAVLSFGNVISLFAVGNDNLWFVKAYLGLYILAPIINSFVEHSSRDQLRNTIIIFYTFQTVFGVYYSEIFIYGGYSAFSFIGLYLVGRYYRLHGIPHGENRHPIWLLILILLMLSIISCYIVGKAGLTAIIFLYSNPLVVLLSLYLFVYFRNLRCKTNRFINHISKSVFAVYIIHSNSLFTNFQYNPAIEDIYNNYSQIKFIGAVSLYIIAIYTLCILIDQGRIFCWSAILKSITHGSSRSNSNL